MRMRYLDSVGVLAGAVTIALFASPSHLQPIQIQSTTVATVPAKRLPIIREFPVSGEADWVAITPDAVWTTGKRPNVLERIDPRRNRIVARIPLPGDACAGIATSTGRAWVPICSGAQRYIIAIDAFTNRAIGRIPFGPPPEGGIATGNGSVWFTIGDGSILMQVDEKTLAVRRQVRLVSGSYNPMFDDGHVWITSVEKNVVSDIAASRGALVAITRVGPRPRFVTCGAGSVWTLNQGDGSLSRVSETSHRVIATIPLGIPGTHGDIDFGAQTVWVTFPGVPLTAVDARRSAPLIQWVGSGGDSLRFGHGSVWLTDLRRGRILRVATSARVSRR